MLISETRRLVIRQLRRDDLPALTDILGDREVMKHSVRGVCDEAATRRFLDWCLAFYEAHGVGPWALVRKDSSALAGFCGIAPETIGDTDEINLGYRLARAHWGMGLATEAVRATLTHAFAVKSFPSVVAIIEPGHAASLRVAEKAGFKVFNNARFHEREVRLYRMTRDQWHAAYSQA